MDTYRLLRECAFGVVDPLVMDGLPDGVAPYMLVPTWLRGQEEQLPRLVRLDSLSVEQIGLLTEHMDREVAAKDVPSIPTLISTHADERTIRSHMVNRMTLHHGGRKALLRFSDPRVLLQLSWMLAPEEFSWLFGPIDQYIVWVHGGWHVIERPTAIGASRPPNQWRALRRIGAINEILTETQDGEGYWKLVAASQRIEQALRRAEWNGLTSEEDQMAFARHAMDVHPEFDRHPHIARLLAGLDTETSYRDSTNLLGDDEWRQIQSEMNGQSGTRKVT